MTYEVINWIDPIPDALVRQMTCYICGKRHLQTGRIANLWIPKYEHSTQAAESCVK